LFYFVTARSFILTLNSSRCYC